MKNQICVYCVALAFHNAQLEASAFSEGFDAESFEDLTLPKVGMIHKVYCIDLLRIGCGLIVMDCSLVASWGITAGVDEDPHK
jgi:hypothetical protein